MQFFTAHRVHGVLTVRMTLLRCQATHNAYKAVQRSASAEGKRNIQNTLRARYEHMLSYCAARRHVSG